MAKDRTSIKGRSLGVQEGVEMVASRKKHGERRRDTKEEGGPGITEDKCIRRIRFKKLQLSKQTWNIGKKSGNRNLGIGERVVGGVDQVMLFGRQEGHFTLSKRLGRRKEGLQLFQFAGGPHRA